MNMLFRAGAIVLAFCLFSPAAYAQYSNCAARDTANNCVPGQVLIDPATGETYKASGGTGGGSAGTEYVEDAAAPANPTAGGLNLRRRDTPSAGEVSADGDWISAISDNQGQLRIRAKELETLLAGTLTVGTHAVTQSGSWNVGLSGSLPAFATTPSFNIGTGGAGVSGTPLYTRPAVGSDSGGRLLPGQGIVATTRTTLTASTATRISASGAVAGRIGGTVQFETSPAAVVFLCTTQGAGCSATSYDFIVPSGAGVGTAFTQLFATTGEVWAYSTGAPTVVFNSWTAQ